ncbi:related to DFM1-ER protein involved in ER-associated protein degradation [Ustilago bromivora]|uniref:Derlin n=1 Tax=Ustilago bromivora TaxID=307758 RepID=A0A1K0FW44_9BASI|nr:related to DFM1-ER protein involved in ER-associated protein degradation [Ustilago bromivora]SYW85137.1 related to DFM1 - ER protein involved in ER-associated protein degradation [Ustilago bromivora]
MDEIRKIPPVTRFLLGATGAVTLPCVLAITTPTRFVLFWPWVISKFHIHRLFSCFFFGGSGLKLLFDLFLLFRNSQDLELNHFGRRTADYTWALLVMGTVIHAANYPLGSAVLFGPMLNALVYVWARANPSSSVSFFGMVNCPSRWLPYVYIGIDLLQGGPALAIQSGTGLLAGYAYWVLDQVLPAQRRGRAQGRSYIPTPGFLQSLLTDSVDPTLAGHNMGDRNARRVAGGTVWNAARDRGHRLSDRNASSASPRLTSIASALGAGARSTFSTLNPFNRSSSSSSSCTAGPNREEMLAAAERRLRASQSSSIVGRNAAEKAPSKPAGSNTASSTSLNARSSAAASGASPSANLRKTAAGGAHSNMFTFGQLNEKGGRKEGEGEEDHSSSGGAVAEQRWGTEKAKAKTKDSDDEVEEDVSTGHSWGGSGQRLGD